MYCHHDSSKLIENMTNPWKGSKAASRSSTSLSYVGVSEDHHETYAKNKPHDDRKILSCTSNPRISTFDNSDSASDALN